MNTKGVEDGMAELPNGLSKVFGTWPGDETDAELLSALDEVRGSAAVPVEEAVPRVLAVELFAALQAMVNYAHAEHKGLRIADEALDRFTQFTHQTGAVPVEERTQVNHIWSGREKMPCGCSAKTEYPYYNAETGHVHCIACGRAFYHQSQIVPEERTAEMEQLVCKHCGEKIYAEVSYTHEDNDMLCDDMEHSASPLDHIEGKAKAESIQEVQE